MLFESICNSQWFIQTSIILFLNKEDLFKQKLPYSSVRKYFPDYTGDPKSFKQASAFFAENFRRLNRNPTKVSPELHLPRRREMIDMPAGYLCAFDKRNRHEFAQNYYD